MGKASKGKKGSINEALVNRGKSEKALKSSQESPSKGSLQKATSIITLIPILIILFVSFAVYFNALFCDFVFDDEYQIVDNPWIRDIRNVPTIFSKSVWSFIPGPIITNYYRPLMHIVYMLNYHLFGLKPWGFHLVNILFHCGVSVLVFLIIRRFLTEHSVSKSSVYFSPPFIAALFFALHPIHTEAVTWIAGLPDVSFAFFYLLSLYLYMLFRDGAKRCYLLSILSFSVAMLFKEPALTLPIILIVYDYLMKKLDATIFVRIKRYLPYVVVSGIYLLARYYALGSFAPIASYADLSTYESIINVFPLFREYLTSLLWPFNLNLWHTFHPINSLFETKGMISTVVTVIFSVVAVTAYRKNNVLFFGLLLLVIPLLPVFYIKGIAGKPYAERYLYLPSVGSVLLLAVFLSWVKEKLPRAVMSITIASMVIVGAYAAGTINRNNIWKDNLSLWTDAARKSPDNPVAHNEVGLAYASKGLLDIAMVEYQTALRLDPDYPKAHNNLGVAYASEGLLENAIAQFQIALHLNPDYPKAHNNLGNVYTSKGLLDMAMVEYQTALRLAPYYTDAHYNLAVLYRRKGNVAMALGEAEVALKIRPDMERARQFLYDINPEQH